ncbi:DNA polymerase elongation subunit (family B) [Salinibacter ruber]|uniref:DNA-directed DNA polymerase n=2 Tax=Salinibacter ruber TaxID=146919 RepID=A0A9X2TG60_9BACT|nr:DNA polymerase domain-containing protein [Salinibacter ruber]MBB4069884.1 DNA polymerase elongation subunit (family B) [Salinibacter ruber]MCS3636679.1 DNA polymerase elongation subunit (family B) [Salinibacter ruber]MCS3661421.1 DNA polymerase elongation subunit (family B) [Salinibacter ruber]MCS3670709.1 DNA polymerase elongation subunit (family B) [Salinibacter ruber]MCS3707329.1 DNA polymerase elongation subunit (family B) [Salinibacter ruber]
MSSPPAVNTPADATQSAADTALFGKDPMPRLVDVHPMMDRPSDEPARVRVYQRSEDFASIHEQEDTFFPFFFLSDFSLLADRYRNGDVHTATPLNGDNFYQYLLTFETWSDYWDALRQVEHRSDSDQQAPDELYRVGSPAQQYLMQTGRSCLLGMTLDDLHRLQLDIEVYSEGSFPNADRPDDKVIIVALSDNRGWDEVLHLRDGIGEEQLLQELVYVLQERDPDVIEGHNIFEFDLAYLLDRCALHGVDFAIGRDGSVPRTYDSSMRFAERTVDYPAVDIVGRHVIDTYFQVMSFDVFSRDLPDYSLKTAARYFDLAPEERTYIEGTEIANAWRTDRATLLEYALDDVIETKRLAGHLSGSTFYLAQMLPMTYGSSARRGPAGKIESLFVREYLRRRHALPRSEWGSQSMGGYTDIFITGVLGPIVYADVESLYPSIMLNYDVQPSGDTLDLFPQLLERLTDLRLETKEDMKEAEEEEVRSELDARQSSYKVLINSFYGLLGFGLSAFNDFEEADRVARTGQQILRQLIDEIRARGGTVIEVDTDGVLFVPPEDVRGEQAEIDYTVSLTEAMPEGIRVGFDGRFEKMLSYKKKNYALLTYDDELKFKGSSLISRSNEPFGRDFVRKAIRRLLDHDVAGLHELYVDTRDKIVNSDWEGVERFARTETLKDTLEQYEADVEAGQRPRAATYELAKEKQNRTGKPVKKGDRITYYITGDDATVTAFKHCRRAEEWDPEDPDENTAYYLKRLDEFASKFEPFFDEADFRLVFSPEDLFGFSADGIEIQREEHASDYAEDQEDVPF